MSECTFSPSVCHVDLGALRRNFARLGEPAALMPVIKSDAYGHGLVPVARALAEAGARRFAVGTVAEGMALREAGLRQKIVVLLGALDDVDWQGAAAQDLIPVVGSFAALDKASAHCHAGRTLHVAVKCETGMGRLGFTQEELPQAVERLRSIQGIAPVMALSHLSCADTPGQEDYTRGQMKRFAAMTATLGDAFPGMERSLANSAATIAWPEAHYDVCRPGIALYGVGADAQRLDLRPVMSLKSSVSTIKTFDPGTDVSYGRTFRTQGRTRIGVLPIGYADGFFRGLSNRMSVVTAQGPAPQRGRICMDMSMIDLTDLPDVKVGDEVEIFGRRQRVDDLAAILNTIPYELTCAVSKRVPRVYIEGGKIVERSLRLL